MDSAGPFDYGDLPDDDAPDEGDFDPRGWIAPEDRLWRHPSEVSDLEHGLRSTLAGSAGTRDQWRERRAAIAAGTLGAAAVVAAAVVVLALTDAPSATTGATPALRAAETSLVTVPAAPVSAAASISSLISSLRPSLVELEPTGVSGHLPMTGVVLPGGDMVITAASAAAGVTRMVVVTSSGKRMSGKVLASDKNSGVAVVSTSGGLVPASFSDADLVPGDLAVTACLSDGGTSRARPTTDASVSTVQGVGVTESSADGSGLMDTIAADTPLQESWGGVLLDGRGDVVGILGGEQSSGAGTVGLFVPSSLALGVAEELESLQKVEHGWIGVSVNDAPAGAGALVSSVFQSSPAAIAGIEPGDLVTAIDSHPISSHADLQARLYTLPPGSPVTLTLERSGTTSVASMELAPQPGG